MATEQQKIWFCGFYEGEGWISNDSSNNNRIRVGIAQNDRTPLDLGQRLWGGTVKVRTRKSPASDKICHGHEWVLYPKEAKVFIDDIRPYMIIPYKIGQVNEALQKQTDGLQRKFKCAYCDETYASPAGRRRHQLKEHLAIGKIFECDICNKQYKSNDSLIRHKQAHHNEDDE
ncbi:hypothetical protein YASMINEVIRUS_125 [Yasminevirus sp. GU-2018]|uniref:C2H2-type domain-containing protein n=1 Tax=Yasminevirus sp. GU-2018 TaxID=2420051 RepID=A0A5K0U8D8_9VIRU|nr:hypothetical protein YASMINEVIRUS_125 [Yasminevirus sp. GU-2018]